MNSLLLTRVLTFSEEFTHFGFPLQGILVGACDMNLVGFSLHRRTPRSFTHKANLTQPSITIKYGFRFVNANTFKESTEDLTVMPLKFVTRKFATKYVCFYLTIILLKKLLTWWNTVQQLGTHTLLLNLQNANASNSPCTIILKFGNTLSSRRMMHALETPLPILIRDYYSLMWIQEKTIPDMKDEKWALMKLTCDLRGIQILKAKTS